MGGKTAWRFLPNPPKACPNHGPERACARCWRPTPLRHTDHRTISADGHQRTAGQQALGSKGDHRSRVARDQR